MGLSAWQRSWFSRPPALELYRRHPHIPRSLILASAYAGWAGSLAPEVAEQRKQGLLQRIEQPEVWVREWLRTLLTDSAPQELVAEVGAILADYLPDAQRTLLLHSGFAEHDVRDILSAIGVPTFLLYGDKDVLQRFRLAQGALLIEVPAGARPRRSLLPDVAGPRSH